MFERGCLVAVTIAAVLLLLSLARLGNSLNSTILQVRTDVHTEALKLDATLTDFDRDAVIASGTLTAIEKGSRRWSTQQDQIAQKTLQAASSLNSTLQAIGGLAVAGSSLLNQQQASLSALEETAGKSISNGASQLASLQPAIQNFTLASKEVAQAAHESGPHLTATLAHADTITGNGAKLSTYYTDKIINPHRTAWEKFEEGLRIAGLVIRAWLAY